MYKELCLSLHGEWRFQLDPEKMGVSEKFYLRELEDNIPLPGSTDEAQKGDGYTEVEIERLTRKYPYTGYAWYQKEVFLESEWVGKHIDLFLERTRISRVWVNDIEIGSRDSLSTPHKYDLSEVLTEGKHKITILIDNSEYPIPGGHLTSGDTQTNWNGILGKIELRGSDLVWIDGIKTYSDVENSVVRLKFLVKNKAAVNGQASISVKVCKLDEEITNKEKQCENIIISEKEYSVNVNEFENNFEINHFIGETGELWDEYSPSLYK
ncbi:MAG: hypothetical protein N3D72_03925, partial [Candidatus Methanomethyliaceae archaeon]|nr:hypothetical protein [Candidatus Methanomethyliaceae archaeon]